VSTIVHEKAGTTQLRGPVIPPKIVHQEDTKETLRLPDPGETSCPWYLIGAMPFLRATQTFKPFGLDARAGLRGCVGIKRAKGSRRDVF
jgi:hypothetical protein